MRKIRKRDGSLQKFNIDKVKLAIQKAFKACGYNMEKLDLTDLYCDIEDSVAGITENEIVELESLQDLIEDVLMDFEFKDVAKNYILYRHERKKIREKAFSEKLLGKNIENQNANVDEMSFGGRQGEAIRVMTKDYALTNCMSKMSRNNHQNNEIYIHDLDSYSVGCPNCLSIPFDQLLRDGFNTRQTDVRPANSINTAFQLVAVLIQIQSLNQFGGVAATHLDWTMVPYVRVSFWKHYNNLCNVIPLCKKRKLDNWDLDKVKGTPITSDVYKGKYKESFVKHYLYERALALTKRELKQAVEGMYHNLNTLQSRSGNQLKLWLLCWQQH